jgi:hypothetical protein
MNTLDAAESRRIDRVEGWRNTDSRTFQYSVTQDGEPRDISEDTLSWALYLKPYSQPDVEPLIDETDPGVSIGIAITTGQASEFEVEVAEGAVSDLWGSLYQHVVVDPPDSSRQSFVGEVWLEDSPEADTPGTSV